MLVLIAAVPGLLNRIPLAALAALLVYVGLRLAAPADFKHMYQQGRGTFIVFMSTIIGVLATDLLIGLAIGIAVQALVHLTWLRTRGIPASALVRLKVDIESDDQEAGDPSGAYDPSSRATTVSLADAAVFSTWIPLRKQLIALAGTQRTAGTPHVADSPRTADTRRLVLDLTQAQLVDTTVRTGLAELQQELHDRGTALVVQLPTADPRT